MTQINRVAFPLASAFALFATPIAAQQAATPMSAEDLITMPRLGAPVVDADGTMAIYSVTSTDPESYKRSGKLWLHRLDDPAARPVALELDGSDAVFGGDGWLYYLADSAAGGEGATSQVWRAHVAANGMEGKKQASAKRFVSAGKMLCEAGNERAAAKQFRSALKIAGVAEVETDAQMAAR